MARDKDDKKDFGYNVSVAVTNNFIREIRADTGAQPDPVAIPALLEAQREYHDLVPDKFIYDAAAGAGKTRAQVNQATGGRTQLVSPLLPYEKRTDLFTPEHFQLSDDGALDLPARPNHHHRLSLRQWRWASLSFPGAPVRRLPPVDAMSLAETRLQDHAPSLYQRLPSRDRSGSHLQSNA